MRLSRCKQSSAALLALLLAVLLTSNAAQAQLSQLSQTTLPWISGPALSAAGLSFCPSGDGAVYVAAGQVYRVEADAPPKASGELALGGAAFTARSIVVRPDASSLIVAGLLNGTSSPRALFRLNASTLATELTDPLSSSLGTLPSAAEPLLALTPDASRLFLSMTAGSLDWGDQRLFSLPLAGWSASQGIASKTLTDLTSAGAFVRVRAIHVAPAGQFLVVVASRAASGGNGTGASEDVVFRAALGEAFAPAASVSEAATVGEAGACLASGLSPDGAALHCFGSAAGGARLTVYSTANFSAPAIATAPVPVPGASCGALSADLKTALLFGPGTAWRFALSGTAAGAPTAALAGSAATGFGGGAAACALSPDQRAAALVAASAPPVLYRFALENGTTAESIARPVGVAVTLDLAWSLWAPTSAARDANNEAARLALAAALRVPGERVELRGATAGSVRLSFLVTDRAGAAGGRALVACDELLRRALAGQLPFLGPFPLLRTPAKPGVELDVNPPEAAPPAAGGTGGAGASGSGDSGGGTNWWQIGVYILAAVAGAFFLLSVVLGAILHAKRRGVRSGTPKAKLHSPGPASPDDDAARI